MRKIENPLDSGTDIKPKVDLNQLGKIVDMLA